MNHLNIGAEGCFETLLNNRPLLKGITFAKMYDTLRQKPFLYKDNLTSKSYWCNICVDVTGAQKENFFVLKSYTCNKSRVEKMVVFRMLM